MRNSVKKEFLEKIVIFCVLRTVLRVYRPSACFRILFPASASGNRARVRNELGIFSAGRVGCDQRASQAPGGEGCRQVLREQGVSGAATVHQGGRPFSGVPCGASGALDEGLQARNGQRRAASGSPSRRRQQRSSRSTEEEAASDERLLPSVPGAKLQPALASERSLCSLQPARQRARAHPPPRSTNPQPAVHERPEASRGRRPCRRAEAGGCAARGADGEAARATDALR